MSKKPEGRTVTPNGTVLKRLRLAQGWRVEDLAEKAGCSAKTINNMEQGRAVFICTLQACAAALEVLPEILLAEGREIRGISVEVKISVAIPNELFDQSEQLVKLIEMVSKIIGATNEIVVTGVKTGSVIITLAMHPGDAEKLLGAFASGKLPSEIIRVVVDVQLHPTAKELCEYREAAHAAQAKNRDQAEQVK